MDKQKPVVGQKLLSLNVGNAARNTEQKLTPVIVTKVGRKYFTAQREGWNFGTVYHLEDWTEKTEYSSNSCLYETEQEWIDDKKTSSHLKTLRNFFDYSGKANKLSLSDLEKIIKIIDEG